MIDLGQLTPVENHATLKPGVAATHNGATGLITEVWQDPAGTHYVEINGPNNEEGLCSEMDISLGGQPDIYAPTLDEFGLDSRSYETAFLPQASGQLPAGWNVLYKPDDRYVAWGLADKKAAEIFAIGHAFGISCLGSKM